MCSVYESFCPSTEREGYLLKGSEDNISNNIYNSDCTELNYITISIHVPFTSTIRLQQPFIRSNTSCEYYVLKLPKINASSNIVLLHTDSSIYRITHTYKCLVKYIYSGWSRTLFFIFAMDILDKGKRGLALNLIDFLHEYSNTTTIHF